MHGSVDFAASRDWTNSVVLLGIIADARVVTDGKYTVYIVDGDEAVRDSLTAFLEAEGYTTKCFVACEDFHAIRHPAEDSCLLLDLHLPRHGGDDLLACLSVRAQQIPVIVMSGAARNTEARALRAGAAAFIEKPLDSDELIRKIRDILA
jgi:FixJ family two-component response regulator